MISTVKEFAVVCIMLLSAAQASFASAHRQDSVASVLTLAPGSAVTAVSPDGYFSEPSIAVNYKNPRQVTVVYQRNVSAAYSTDGGNHWMRSSGLSIPSYRGSGDVSVVYDNEGHAIMSCIAFDNLGTEDYWGHGATRNGIFIKRSLDGGKKWEANTVVVDSQGTKPGIPFEDKPYIVADNTGSPFAGRLYIGWTEWRLTESVILFSRSADDGITWSKPVDISDVHGLPRDDNGGLEGFDGTVTPDGVLHVVWTNGDEIIYKTSADGGKTFTPDRAIIKTAPAMFKPAGVYRANGFPQIASDARGRLYITWSDYRNGDIDVFESYSSDSGKVWSPPVRVNNDSLHDGADQFMQWLTVDRATGDMYVIFYDRRMDPLNVRAWVVVARSSDGGNTFSNYLMSDSSFAPDGAFIGDYNGLAAFDGRVYGAWTERVPRVELGRNDASVVKVGVANFNVIK